MSESEKHQIKDNSFSAEGNVRRIMGLRRGLSSYLHYFFPFKDPEAVKIEGKILSFDKAEWRGHEFLFCFKVFNAF